MGLRTVAYKALFPVKAISSTSDQIREIAVFFLAGTAKLQVHPCGPDHTGHLLRIKDMTCALCQARVPITVLGDFWLL